MSTPNAIHQHQQRDLHSPDVCEPLQRLDLSFNPVPRESASACVEKKETLHGYEMGKETR